MGKKKIYLIQILSNLVGEAPETISYHIEREEAEKLLKRLRPKIKNIIFTINEKTVDEIEENSFFSLIK